MLKVLLSIIICELVGIFGSVATTPAIPGWYASLKKPSFNPPNWVFGPVWTLLYALMGISAYLVWNRGWEKKEVRIALVIFGIQLILNTLWSFIFFKFQSPGWALVEIIVLWLAILVTVLNFMKISKPAGWLLVPYLLWVSFAAFLNFSIFRLNL
jgi:benzodiazapine receptor